MRLVFDGTRFTVEVPDRSEFFDALRGAAIGWPFAAVKGAGEPVATVRTVGKKYQVRTDDNELIETTAVSAACSVIVDVVKGYVEENPSRLCLHCGSVAFAGRLVIFPSEYRAGKSTLVARLAAGGHQVFGDDVLPLSDDDARGIALGLAPRLRLPLPENAAKAFQQFVAKHAGPGDGYYQYLDLPDGRLARRGATLPLGAVVLLDRQADGAASLGRASRSAALQALITRNFARTAPAGDLLDRLRRVMDRLPLFALRYSDLEAAAELLERTFAQWPPHAGEIAFDARPASGEAVVVAGDLAAKIAGLRLRQNPAIKLHAVDGELFLADAEGLAIHHLNAMGAGLWNLLAEPVTEAEAAEVLCGAFPDADPAAIAHDVRTLFAALFAGQFVIPA